MSEAVSFWMDNKNCTGKIVVIIEDQTLVLYRDRYYVLKDGTALSKGGKPLRYSLSSLPVPWKRALKGEAQLPAAVVTEPEPMQATPKQPRQKKEKPVMLEPIPETVIIEPEKQPVKVSKPTKKVDKHSVKAPVIAICPYCKTSHEIPIEKGKSGKPFLLVCSKCNGDFAVRFVEVTIYQAEVAGFLEKN
jgi:hypothetical protein